LFIRKCFSLLEKMSAPSTPNQPIRAVNHAPVRFNAHHAGVLAAFANQAPHDEGLQENIPGNQAFNAMLENAANEEIKTPARHRVLSPSPLRDTSRLQQALFQ
jgi:hypothetical protein